MAEPTRKGGHDRPFTAGDRDRLIRTTFKVYGPKARFLTVESTEFLTVSGARGYGYRIEVFQPHPALTSFVKCYRRLSTVPDESVDVSKVPELPLWPTASTEVCLVFGGRFGLEDGFSTFSADAPGGFVVGTKLRADRANFIPGIELINVSFAPGGAAALLGVAAREVSGRYVRLEDLGDRSLTGWDGATAEHLESVPAEGKISCVESWLLRRLTHRDVRAGHVRGAQPNANVARALSLLDAAGGRVSVRDLEHELGTSRRTLERLFEDRVGISPKGYARLARIRQAKRMISETPATQFSLGYIARECGYQDQPHMTHEFSRIVGLTPDAIRRLVVSDLVAFLQDRTAPSV